MITNLAVKLKSKLVHRIRTGQGLKSTVQEISMPKGQSKLDYFKIKCPSCHAEIKTKSFTTSMELLTRHILYDMFGETRNNMIMWWRKGLVKL